jgi:OmpA-OmpF porin, OOP family
MNRIKQILAALCIFISAAAVAQMPTVENNQLKLNAPVLFKTGTDKLEKASDSVLMQVKNFLNGKNYISLLRVEGHTSPGNETANQLLSEQRAMAICRWLVEKGIDGNRVLPVGFGSSKPAFDNASSEGRTQNNRTVFVIAALNGHLIGGLPADGGGKIAGARN